MDDLIVFMRQCLDEDERVALAADSGRWLPEDKGITFEWRADDFHGGEAQARLVADTRANQWHIANWDPARVLAEIEAKRERIAWLLDLEHEPGPEGFPTWESCRLRWTEDMAGDQEIGYCSCGLDSWRNRLFRFEAQPYAGWPGWREEWAA